MILYVLPGFIDPFNLAETCYNKNIFVKACDAHQQFTLE